MTFPVFLKLTKVPGGNTENKNVELFGVFEGSILDIKSGYNIVTDGLLDFLGSYFRVAGGRTVKQTNLQ